MPYIWKELGTSCRNLPKVHTIVRMMRMILVLRRNVPGVIEEIPVLILLLSGSGPFCPLMGKKHIDELKWLYMELYDAPDMFEELCSNMSRVYKEFHMSLSLLISFPFTFPL